MNVRYKLRNLHIEKRAYIDGNFINAKSGEIINKVSSIDGTDLSGIAACDNEDVDIAVNAAKKAFESGTWKNSSIIERKEVMLRLADLMEQNREELALLDTYETGRAYQNYYYDSIPKAIECIKYFAEAIDKYYDKTIPHRLNDFGIITHAPLGVIGAITPWNDPLVVDAWKFAPALLMGNSIVIKPAEQASFSLLKVASLTKEAGIPDGVFNVVTGYGEIAGSALALHKDVRGIYFTGSSEVGKKMLCYSGASNMKKVYLECGGKGPYIVTDKCNRIKEAAKVLADSMFYNQGQICSAPSRVIIFKNVYDEFLEQLKIEYERYVPGDPFEIENNVGCIVSREQFEKVNKYIELAAIEGEVFQAKKQKNKSNFACCIQPTIITGISHKSKVAMEEIFGPVVVILPVDSAKEALTIANDSNYGLAGAVWTDNLDEAYYFSRNMEIGLVHINSYGNDDNSAPFGGVKESGLGKDKSIYSFEEYTDLKTIWMHFRG